MSSDAQKRAEEALLYNRTHANSPRVRAALVEALEALLASEPAPPAGAEVARLTALLRECNAVCLCGCPESEHESYGEDGEGCGHDDHECLRVAPAVLEIVQRYRVALSDALAQKPAGAEVREAAERLDIIGEAWSCGDTDAKEMYRCGRRLLAALRAAAGSAPGGDAVREAAEDVVRGDWWGHYCPSCGSTFKHGPECRIGRLAEALSSARAAKGGAE